MTSRRAELSLASLLLVLVACAGNVPPPESPDDGPGPEVAVSLRLLDGGEDAETGTPRSHVELALIHPDGRRDVRPVGRFAGVCTHEESPDALVAIRCWWAGQGTNLSLQRAEDTLRIVRVDVDEMSGEGEPSEAMAVELPARATLRIVGR